jgi:UDPglucose--hexose-1-phosphate uridylyltransferase
MDPLLSTPHRRRNPLTGDWVLVSPHRLERPWLGRVEAAPTPRLPAYDPQCYLCPGNARAHGDRNPAYTGTYVFDNDFPALLPQVQEADLSRSRLLQARSQIGECRVVCFSPRHDLTLPQLSHAEVRDVVETWIMQVAELGEKYRWVQVFENKGELMGCSNPHPHGQIWASHGIPTEPAKEDQAQADYLRECGSSLLLDYATTEAREAERVILGNDAWLAVVPFWAVWPFESLLLPRRHVRSWSELEGQERDLLADILIRLLGRYDRLFDVSFPYSMGWHAAPGGTGATEHWQLHAHVYPPLLRSAQVRKFMVGYEMLAEPQRDLTPEQAAERLRRLGDLTPGEGEAGS